MRFSSHHAESGLKHMIGKIGSLYSKLLSRIVAPTGVSEKHPDATPPPAVRRRVEVTVERETVSVLVRGAHAKDDVGSAREESGPEAPAKELPPPAQSPVAHAEQRAPEDRGPPANNKLK
jgi:hypothetical protein